MPTNKQEYMKEYYKNNRENLRKNLNSKVKCDVCKTDISKSNYAKHLSTEKHKNNELLRVAKSDDTKYLEELLNKYDTAQEKHKIVTKLIDLIEELKTETTT